MHVRKSPRIPFLESLGLHDSRWRVHHLLIIYSEIAWSHKTPVSALRDWRFIILGTLWVAAAALVIAGGALAFRAASPFGDADSDERYPAGVRVLRAGVFIFVALASGLPYCAWHAMPEDKRQSAGFVAFYLLLATGGPFLATRLVWAVGSAFSLHLHGAAFSPFRDTNASVWVNLGTAVVMEFLISALSLFHIFWMLT